ncbi:MAG TPA: methylated-DNA--[protein]-cysteine S-methyltransferase [Planctomicrobium sp.]|nr:methylated-DNA--[protein]-cysteine S-methyltransferase [Planctomicrobium sp.]
MSKAGTINSAGSVRSKENQPVQKNWTSVFKTDLGWVGFIGTEQGLVSLTFGQGSRQETLDTLKAVSVSRTGLPDWMDDARELLTAYARGESVDISQIPLNITHRTPFEKRVREQLLRIGYGQTISYGELAAAAGKPRAARAVGTVMSRNPIPLVIPCHRVLGAQGKLGGYSAPSGLEMKRRLLQLESPDRDGAIK